MLGECVIFTLLYMQLVLIGSLSNVRSYNRKCDDNYGAYCEGDIYRATGALIRMYEVCNHSLGGD